jgi:hypothetical protein
MKLWLAIHRLLSVLAVLGLVLAPFTAPAVAGGMTALVTRAGTQMDMALPGSDRVKADVPCCLPARPVTPECPKACPLTTHCLSKIFQGVLAMDAAPSRFGIAQAQVSVDDAAPDMLSQAPPSRPPQA